MKPQVRAKQHEGTSSKGLDKVPGEFCTNGLTLDPSCSPCRDWTAKLRSSVSSDGAAKSKASSCKVDGKLLLGCAKAESAGRPRGSRAIALCRKGVHILYLGALLLDTALLLGSLVVQKSSGISTLKMSPSERTSEGCIPTNLHCSTLCVHLHGDAARTWPT